jgi:hypothetical protein
LLSQQVQKITLQRNEAQDKLKTMATQPSSMISSHSAVVSQAVGRESSVSKASLNLEKEKMRELEK